MYDANIKNARIEKTTLVILRPRARITGWTNVSGNIYSVPFSRGIVTRLWSTYANDDGLTKQTSTSLSLGQFYYDSKNKLLYVYSFTNPDSDSYPGRTVEFELNISGKDFTGPRDPLDQTSEIVNWTAALAEAPLSQNGSVDSLYGFYPLNEGGIKINNANGWMNEILLDTSFNSGIVKAYILANEELEDGVIDADVRQIFLGYSNGIVWGSDFVNVSCTDFFSLFDKNFKLGRKLLLADFPLLDPKAYSVVGKEYYARRVFGMVDGMVPVNIDYSPAPSTSNNRKWITHDIDGAPAFVGTVGYVVDHTAANTTTRTYFTTAPRLTVLDWLSIVNSGTPHRVPITVVNIALKYIEHPAITRTVAAGDIATRYFVGAVTIEDPSGTIFNLLPERDFNIFVDSGLGVAGFILTNNFEAGNPNSPFDPANWKINCRVYGTREIQPYSSSDPIGSLSDHGGTASKALSILARVVQDGGFNIAQIDQGTFDFYGANSHSIGLAIPEAFDGSAITYRDAITKILETQIWALSFSDTVGGIKMGLSAISPFTTSGDYTADEYDHFAMDFQHQYKDIYSDIICEYGIKELLTRNDTGKKFALASSATAKDLHFVSRQFSKQLLQYDQTEAQKIADRLSYALGERRGLYKFQFGQEFLNKSGLGASYKILRQALPGFPLKTGTERSTELSVIEVSKSSNGIAVTMDDQKGVQDHSGAW